MSVAIAKCFLIVVLTIISSIIFARVLKRKCLDRRCLDEECLRRDVDIFGELIVEMGCGSEFDCACLDTGTCHKDPLSDNLGVCVSYVVLYTYGLMLGIPTLINSKYKFLF